MASSPTARNGVLFLPYALPFLVYTGVAGVPTEWGLSLEGNYALRFVATSATLAWGWRSYLPLRGPASPGGSIALGSIVGVVGTVAWVALKSPFYPEAGEPWTREAFALRVLASGSVVPLFEELLFRGFLLRSVVQWQEERGREAADALNRVLRERSIDELPAGAWTPLAVTISALAFAAGHSAGEYLAALAYGFLMAALLIARRDLLSCVAAHAVTNVTLALYVVCTGRWAIW